MEMGTTGRRTFQALSQQRGDLMRKDLLQSVKRWIKMSLSLTSTQFVRTLNRIRFTSMKVSLVPLRRRMLHPVRWRLTQLRWEIRTVSLNKRRKLGWRRQKKFQSCCEIIPTKVKTKKWPRWEGIVRLSQLPLIRELSREKEVSRALGSLPIASKRAKERKKRPKNLQRLNNRMVRGKRHVRQKWRQILKPVLLLSI